MTRILSLVCALLFSGTAIAGVYTLDSTDPNRHWEVATTPHFRINYDHTQRKQAEQVADIAERAYAKLTRQLQWEPSGQIEIVVIDEFDIVNSFATVLPFNREAIFLTPPDEGELLHNSVWLESVIPHELTHVIHMDKARGTPGVMRWIFGRQPLLFPNAWQPSWGLEGIATYNESIPETGQGRLRGPLFEALMRIEAQYGFKSLSEMNAGGRALPTSKDYLYGAYFYDFLARRYGEEAIYKYIHRYSGNPPLVARLHTNPTYATGKTMNVLWEEFIADLKEQMAERSAPLKTRPEVVGERILPAHFRIHGLSPSTDGGVLAVVNDGLTETHLLHVTPEGRTKQLTTVHSGTRIDVRADGNVLLAQPEVCNNYRLYYDLYTWSEAQGERRHTECGRYRRAVWLGDQVAALRVEGGIARLVILDADKDTWQETRTLYQTPDQVEAIDLAAHPDGQHIALLIKQAGAWQVLGFDASGSTPNVLFNYDAPIHSLRYAHSGNALEFIAVHDNVYNLWRYDLSKNVLARLSHTYTAVLLHSGVMQDGSVVLGVLDKDGIELRHLAHAATLETVSLRPQKDTPLPGAAPPITHPLGAGDEYNALYSMYPRAWLPASYIDRDMHAYGVQVFGSDALGWHHYAATAMWETSQHEPVGSFQYDYLNHHFFSVSRDLQVRQAVTVGNAQHATRYDRATDLQWVSMLPWLQEEHRFYAGIGAALQTIDNVQTGYGGQTAGLSTPVQNERIAAAFVRYDSRKSNWYADGFNRGNLTTLLYESYRPFRNDYSGHIVRFDTRGYLSLGRSVLSARWTEVHAQGLTEPFYLGGSSPHELSQVPMLNQRELPLRGYLRGQMALTGQNARTAGIEWRMPLADIDRHAMTPPVGINRLSGSIFLDAGQVWNNMAPRSKYYRSIGIELIGEIKFIYLVTLPVTIGIARGLDHPGQITGYLQLGTSF